MIEFWQSISSNMKSLWRMNSLYFYVLLWGLILTFCVVVLDEYKVDMNVTFVICTGLSLLYLLLCKKIHTLQKKLETITSEIGFYKSDLKLRSSFCAFENNIGQIDFADDSFRENFIKEPEVKAWESPHSDHRVLDILFAHDALKISKEDQQGIIAHIKEKKHCNFTIFFKGNSLLVAGSLQLNGCWAWHFSPIQKEQATTVKVKERNEYLHTVIDKLPFGFISCDSNFVIIEANKAAHAFFGKNLSTSVSNISYFHPQDKATILEFFKTIDESDQKKIAPIDVRILGDQDTIVSMDFILKGKQGDRDHILIYLTDITNRKKLEGQFAQSQKMQAIGQLAGGVAHDFNNMLTAIIGFCDLLMLRHLPGDPSFADTMQIKQNANRAAGLVRQLLAFSRQEKVMPQILNIADIFSEISSLLHRVIGENIELDIVHGRNLGRIKFNQIQFEQVVINLAVNARDAMGLKGKLSIQTDNFKAKKSYPIRDEVMPAGDYVSISVTDTGHGIPKNILMNLFEPFFTTKDVGQGTGLGLSMVFGAVKEAGGYVFAHSSGEGEGATFIIYLPLEEGDVTAPSDMDSEQYSSDDTGRGRVLLVEDEDGVRLFAARALRSKGYVVVEARSGVVALDVLKEEEEDFDLLVTDMMMPKVSGADVIHFAREVMPNMPVICISGYTKETIAEELAGMANIYFLPKPFSLKQLTSRVRQAFDSADIPVNDYKSLPLG